MQKRKDWYIRQSFWQKKKRAKAVTCQPMWVLSFVPMESWQQSSRDLGKSSIYCGTFPEKYEVFMPLKWMPSCHTVSIWWQQCVCELLSLPLSHPRSYWFTIGPGGVKSIDGGLSNPGHYLLLYRSFSLAFLGVGLDVCLALLRLASLKWRGAPIVNAMVHLLGVDRVCLYITWNGSTAQGWTSHSHQEIMRV